MNNDHYFVIGDKETLESEYAVQLYRSGDTWGIVEFAGGEPIDVSGFKTEKEMDEYIEDELRQYLEDEGLTLSCVSWRGLNKSEDKIEKDHYFVIGDKDNLESNYGVESCSGATWGIVEFVDDDEIVSVAWFETEELMRKYIEDELKQYL